ncbi:GNAT family N-acetyltransferase [Planosporangium thailandense]|uniref:GNAT family N-acetyltransferase n=2 Tax=Planosporangium thailandense TaxID=765197 RepID=A0ABX0XUU0_9ACTN|nr:GNAT family N-acetyltransferase [Planosporangium thailandense]
MTGVVDAALPADFPSLLTPRLEIRGFRAGDAEAFSAYRSDPDVARYQGWTAPYPLASAQRFIEALADRDPWTPGEWFQVAIAPREGGVLIGDCGMRPDAADPRIVEIGFSLAREHQGRGLATEAICRLLAYFFDERGVHRVVAGCDVRNTRSAALLERVGMRREAHFVESEWFKGEWTSEYRYALLCREWVRP